MVVNLEELFSYVVTVFWFYGSVDEVLEAEETEDVNCWDVFGD